MKITVLDKILMDMKVDSVKGLCCLVVRSSGWASQVFSSTGKI